MKDLLDCATRVFISQGYRRTQMSDVAEALGVAKGTLYLYVESKQALFEAVLRYADGSVPALSELDLPLAAAAPGELLGALRDSLAREAVPPALARALEAPAPAAVAVELEEIVRQLFRLSSRRRTTIKLIDRCGRDHPELAEAFYAGGRVAQRDALVAYLDRRVAEGALRPVPAAAAAARFVIEAVATWAVHMHWDPAPQPIDPIDAERVVVHFVVGALAGPLSHAPA